LIDNGSMRRGYSTRCARKKRELGGLRKVPARTTPYSELHREWKGQSSETEQELRSAGVYLPQRENPGDPGPDDRQPEIDNTDYDASLDIKGKLSQKIHYNINQRSWLGLRLLASHDSTKRPLKRETKEKGGDRDGHQFRSRNAITTEEALSKSERYDVQSGNWRKCKKGEEDRQDQIFGQMSYRDCQGDKKPKSGGRETSNSHSNAGGDLISS